MWIPVALGRDVPAGVTRAVLVDGEERVVWRGADGRVQVWEDRCPHRGMRLSLGFVRGNALNCLYHGWEYDSGASCVRIPAHPDLEVPRTIRAKAFAAAEGAGMIWTRRAAGDEPLPALPDGRPLASLAVEADEAAILALCSAAPQTGAQLVVAELDGIGFVLGWHRVGPGRTMLHAATSAPVDAAAGLAALRDLRRRAETRELAA